jgi:hypothetical protein
MEEEEDIKVLVKIKTEFYVPKGDNVLPTPIVQSTSLRLMRARGEGKGWK